MTREDYINYEPQIGDNRYANLPDKYAIDIVRREHYKKYGKDPSVTYLREARVLFYDYTLPIVASCYYIRGKFPFKIHLQLYSDFPLRPHKEIPNPNLTVAISVEKERLTEENADFIIHLIKLFSDRNINLIVGDGVDKEYIISYISPIDFNKGTDARYNFTPYYGFFERLCDNNTRNIVYVGNDLKTRSTPEALERVEEEYFSCHKNRMIESGVFTEEGIEENNKVIRKKLIK